MTDSTRATAPVGLPRWVLVWFIITTCIQTYDACYELLGPLSHAGGPLAGLWAGHNLYGNYDATYGGTQTSPWGEAQSWMNLAEVVVLIIVLSIRRSRPVTAVVVGLAVSSLTFWKTVAYFVIEVCSGLENTRAALDRGDLAGFLFIGVLPNLFWIVLPLLSMMSLGKVLKRGLVPAVQAA